MAQSSPHWLIFQRAIAIFRPNTQVIIQARNLFDEYTSNQQQQLMAELIPCVAQISMFVAQSIQQLRDLKGRRISGVGLAFSRLIRNCASIPLIIDQLNKFIRCIQIQPNFMEQIEQCIQKYKQTCQLMHNFQQYFNSLSLMLVQSVEFTRYKQFFVELAWIMYIDCKQNFINVEINEEINNKCLLASIFYFMIRYSLDYIYPKVLRNDRNSEKRVIIGKILAFLLDVFQISDIQLYKKIADKFDEYAQQLINSFTLRTVGSDTDFFSPFIIYLNYKQLQNKYQKSLESKDIDLRVFRKQKQKSLTPINKQALKYRVGMKNHDTLSKSMSRQFKSHRMLNYEQTQQRDNQKSASKFCHNPENGLKRRQNQSRPHSLSASFSNKLQSELQGVNIQIYRYVKTLTKQNQGAKKSYNRQIMKDIESILERTKFIIPRSNLSTQMAIYSIYQSLYCKIFRQQQQLQFLSHNCVLAISFFILDKMYQQSSDQNHIVNYMHDNHQASDMINLWCCLDYVVNKDQNLSPRLLRMFQWQKQQILTQYVWRDCKYIDELAQLAANYGKPQHFQQFTLKLFQYCENFIQKMAKQLQIPNQISLHTYNCLKFIFSANGNILKGCHLDQILMCSLYIAGKTASSPILFTHIKQAYQMITRNKQINYQQIFNKVVEDQYGIGDIIYFYNKYFLKSVEPFVPYIANPSLSLLHQFFQRQLSFSPILNHYQNVINLMETQKPKAPNSIHAKNQQKKSKIGIVIQSQRNQTRIRIRPQNNFYHLCQTQRIKLCNKPKLSQSQDQQ